MPKKEVTTIISRNSVTDEQIS